MNTFENNLFVFFFWTVITSIAYFFGMASYIPFPEKLYSGDRIFLSLALLSVSVFIILVHYRRYLLFRKGLFETTCFSLFLLLLVQAVFSFVRYNQPMFFVVKEALYYVVVLFLYFVFIQFQNRMKTEQMIESFIKASLLCSLIAVVAFFLYSYCEINLLKFSTAENHLRNGTLRFDVGKNIVFIGMIASLTKLIRNEHSKIDVLNIVLGTIHICFVMKTRTVVFYFLILFALCPFFVAGAKVKWKWVSVVLFVITSLFAVAFFQKLVNVWISLWSDDVGNVVRIEAIQFYLKQFCESPIFGMGFISNNSDSLVSNLLKGENGNFYRDDVGLIGLMNEFGIVGVFWLGCFFKKTLWFVRGKADLSSNVVKMLIVYSVISLPNLCVMDSQRVILIAVIMIFIEYIYREDVYDTTLKK